MTLENDYFDNRGLKMEIEFWQHLQSGNIYVREGMSDWAFKIDLTTDPTISINKIVTILKENYCFLDDTPVPPGLHQFAYADLLSTLTKYSKIIAVWSNFTGKESITWYYLRNRTQLSESAEKFLQNSNL